MNNQSIFLINQENELNSNAFSVILCKIFNGFAFLIILFFIRSSAYEAIIKSLTSHKSL